MIDLNHLEKYRENNRIEAKRALGGLPKSVWETYSAFANTLGGIILLGVEEHRDKTLHTVDLPDPVRLVSEFWEIADNPRLTSVNILSEDDVRIENVGGDHIIVITVPRAKRSLKPVYVDGNPLNTYRRSGEGDYRCSKEEYQSMLRDASMKTQDMRILEQMDMGAFNLNSVRSYRGKLDGAGVAEPEPELLQRLGAAEVGEDGELHPTAAGLLMFGGANDIVREYPHYSLDFREYDGERCTRLLSGDEGWSGNLFDFYVTAFERLKSSLPDAENAQAVRSAVGEALANCLVNADYYGSGGIIVIKRPERIIMSNPGDFRIEVSAAKSGGFSDPRNSVLMKLFNLIGVGEREGSGIPGIIYAWRQQGWSEPAIRQSCNPSRIELLLPLTKGGDKKLRIKTEGSKAAVKSAVKRAMIIEYLTDHAEGGVDELSELLEVKPSNVKTLVGGLIDEGIVSAEESGGRYIFRLKA